MKVDDTEDAAPQAANKVGVGGEAVGREVCRMCECVEKEA